MSIAVIDSFDDLVLQGDYKERIIVILCNETSLIPDSIHSESINFTDIPNISRQGYSHLRTSSELQRGIIIGLLYTKYPDIVIYTSRRDLYTQYIPPSSFQLLNTVPSSKKDFSYVSPNNDSYNKEFDTIYQESLNKYVTSFLREKSIRATKYKSAKAQAKNIVDGIIASLNKKSIKRISTNSEDIVEAIFADLERYEIITIGISLEYNDELINLYFSRGSTREFIPEYRNASKPQENFNNQNFYEYKNQKNEPNPDFNRKEPEEIKKDVSRDNIEIKKDVLGDNIDYTEYTSFALEKILEDKCKIISVLHLYRNCMFYIREYNEINNKILENELKNRLTSKLMLFLMEIYFKAESDLTNEEIINNYQKNFTIKLSIKE